ncbi:MAG: hypothetical protein K2J95_05120 [Lachnospiraceae bacterium]|nr:hypothetical protein [Lachnospiraceae bacterium]
MDKDGRRGGKDYYGKLSLCATIDFAPFWLLKRMVDFVEIAIEQGEDTALKI